MSLQRPESAIFSSRTFVVAVWLFVLVLALFLLANSPLFRLQRVEVLGASLMQEGEIVERAGLQLELPLYAIDLNDAAARLREDPVIAEVRLRRRLPDTIVVTLKERRAVGFLTTREAFWAVDAEAIPLFVTESPSLGLPLITLESPVEPRLGEAIPDARLAEVLQFVGALTVTGLAALSEVHAQSDDIVAYTRDRVSISLGRDGDMPEKARVLEGLLKELQVGKLSIAHIDLRHPKSPAIRDRR